MSFKYTTLQHVRAVKTFEGISLPNGIVID